MNNIEEKLNEVYDMLSQVLQNQKEMNSFSSEPFGTYLLRWYELYKLPKNRANTSKEMLRNINLYIMPTLGNVPLKDLTGDRLQAVLNSVKRSNTREKVGLILHGSLKKAYKLRLIGFNPFEMVEIRRHRPVHYKPLNSEQQNVLLGLIDNEYYRAIMTVLICTGMRIGEFLAVDFSGIDYDRRFICIDKTIDIHNGQLNPYTKSDTSTRNVPFSASLERDLSTIAKAKAHGYSFSYNSIKLYFSGRYEKMGIKRNIHSFRHTFVSMCYYVLIPPKTIQKMVGHATLEMTMNVYTHILNPDLSPFAEYFRELAEDLKMRPTDFWEYDTC